MRLTFVIPLVLIAVSLQAAFTQGVLPINRLYDDAGSDGKIDGVGKPAVIEGTDRTWLVAGFVGGLLVLGGVLFLVMRRPSPANETAQPSAFDDPGSATQAQKMQSLGTLAGGIAHDFNNYLLAIMGFAELAKGDAGGRAAEHLDQVLATCERARELSSRVLEFGRKSEPRLGPTNISAASRRGIGLLRAVLPTNIHLQEELNPFTGIVLADENQLHQVLLNLGLNAADAMRGSHGALRVTLDRVTVGEELARELAGALVVQPGDFARLANRIARPRCPMRFVGPSMGAPIVERAEIAVLRVVSIARAGPARPESVAPPGESRATRV